MFRRNIDSEFEAGRVQGVATESTCWTVMATLLDTAPSRAIL